jgi:hypothetical protein
MAHLDGIMGAMLVIAIPAALGEPYPGLGSVIWCRQAVVFIAPTGASDIPYAEV